MDLAIFIPFRSSAAILRGKECRYGKMHRGQSCSSLHALHAGENGVFLRRFVTELLPVNGREGCDIMEGCIFTHV